MSFTDAARELCITQTAVSHQVKSLENELGLALFRRGPKRVSLTADGQAWAAELGPIFAQLHAAHRKLRRPPEERRSEVALSIIPSFGNRWLVPRLGKFLDRHPAIEFRISATERLVNFEADGIDLGIRYGGGRYPGLAVKKLLDDAWVVVAAPRLLAQRRLRDPHDLGSHMLIHDDAPQAWEKWFEANGGIPAKGIRRHTELEDSSMLVEAAVWGQGVALARWSLIVDELAAGRLILPFPKIPPLPTGLAYYLVAPRENLRRASVAAFWDWVLREAVTLRTPESRTPPR